MRNDIKINLVMSCGIGTLEHIADLDKDVIIRVEDIVISQIVKAFHGYAFKSHIRWIDCEGIV